MEGLSKCKADLTVYVHPSKSNNVRQAILQQLSSLLFKYDEVFEGVILAYEAEIQGKTGKILPGLIPHFGVKVEANLLLFSPRPNMFVEGKVVKLGKESIHVIVLGFSSASIMLEDIRSEFKYKTKDGVGVFSSINQKRHVIRAGSMIRFLVKSFDEETLHLYGSLTEANTGCIRWLSKHGAEAIKEPRSSLKRPRESDITKEDTRLLNSSRPPKSRKKHMVE